MGSRRFQLHLSRGLDLLTLGAILFVAFTLWAPGREAAPRPAASPVGRPAPLFHLLGLEGDSVRQALARTLVFVFRSDCPVCQQQKENWRVMAAAGRELGFGSLAVTPEAMTRPIADYFDADPAIAVRQLASLDALRRLGVDRVPTTLVVDGKGVVRYRQAGVVQWGDSLLRTLP